MPPPGETCNRCRESRAPPGESWCIACSAWESLGRELAAHWDHAGCKVIASDIVLNCARQVRALRSFGAGLTRAPEGAGVSRASTSGISRTAGTEPKSKAADRRPTLPRHPATRSTDTKKEDSPVDEEEEDFVEEEEEEEEEAPESVHRPLPGGNKRPPEPPFPPPKVRKLSPTAKDRERRGQRDRDHHRRDSDRRRTHRPGHRRKANKRAGRKHQRLYRLAENPLLRVHRKPADDFLKLSYLEEGRTHLDRDIL